MSATHCPFDGQFCPEKERYFSVFQNAILQSGGAFQINPGAFDGCPIISEQDRICVCTRYANTRSAIQQIKTYEYQ